MREKNFEENRDVVLLRIKFLDNRIFLTYRLVDWLPHACFRYCETKSFRQKIVISPLCKKNLRYLKLSKLRMVYLRVFFRTVRRKKNDRKSWYPPPPLSQTFFDIRVFLNTEGFPYKFFRHCETNIFQQKIVIPFCMKYRNQWWNWCLWKFFEN